MAFQGIRDKMNQDQKPFIIGGIVMMCVALGLVAWELKPVSAPSAPSSYYFYDLANGRITTEPATAIPPLKGAGGKDTLVRAFMFTCSTCGDKKVGYLMKYSAEGRAALAFLAHPPGPSAPPEKRSRYAAESSQYKLFVGEGTLVRLPAKGSPWISAMSFQGMKLVRHASHCPGNRNAKPCLP